MILLTPLGLLAGALAAPLVGWYLLRSRRPRRTVASTLLFAPERQTASAAVPWQPFRPDRTFWLVLLALLLGTAALARPALAIPAEVADHTIVVVDASASMQATTEDGRTRLDLARDTIRDLVDRVGADQVMSIVQAAAQAQVLVDAQPGRAALDALDRLEAGDTAPALDQALTLAGALARPGEPTVVHLVTDSGVPADALALAPAGTVVDVVGSSRPNAAVAAVRGTPLGAQDARVLVEVASFADLPLTARVAFRVDGAEVASRRVDLPPRGRVDVEAEVGGIPDGVVEVALAVAGDGPSGDAIADAHPHDDRAWIVLPDRQGLQVLVAGPENLFLDAALAALPEVSVVRHPAVPADVGQADVVVVDRVAVPDDLDVPTLAVAPTALPDGARQVATAERPAITHIEADDPLLADVDLARLAVAEAAVVEAPELRPVVDGPDGPLLLRGRLDGTATVLVPFALADSTLPLEVAFPVLLANALQVLGGPPADVPLVAGADRGLPLPPQVSGVLGHPDGPRVVVGGVHPRATLDRTGIWTFDADDGPEAVPPGTPTRLAVNPDVGESDLTVTDIAAARVGDDVPSATEVVVGEAVEDPADGPPTTTAEGRLELSRWFLLAAAAVVAVEVLASSRQPPRRRAGAARAAAQGGGT